jgi:hypothetical protein
MSAGAKEWIVLTGLMAGTWFSPGLDELIKVYIIGLQVFIWVLAVLLLRIAWLRDLIVKHIVAAVLQEVMRDPDIQKLTDIKGMQDRIYQRLREDIKRGRDREADATSSGPVG